MGKRTNTAKWITSRSRWQINVQKDGVRRTFTSSTPGRAGQREANAKADAWLDEGLVNQNTRVSVLWDQFIAHEQALTGSANVKNLQCYGRNYILPIIGHLRVDKLTQAKLQQALELSFQHGTLTPHPQRRRAKGPLSKKTLMNIAATEKKFVKYLRTELHATTLDPTLTIPTSARTRPKQILQPDALRILFSSDKTLYRGKLVMDDYIYAYRLQTALGLRPGELLGLQVGDVRLDTADGGRLYIRRSINRDGIVTEGKNDHALREITLPPIAKQILRAQLQLLRDQGIPLNFTTSLFQITAQSSYRRRWQLYQQVNNIVTTRPITPYELRHTFVSIVKYLPAGQIKPLVGHSDAMDTFGQYSHAINGEAEQLASDVNALFSKILSANA